MRPPPLKHASKCGVIKLRFRKRSRTLTYEQKGGNQSTAVCERTGWRWSTFAWNGNQIRLPIGLLQDLKKGVGLCAFWIARVENATPSFWRERWGSCAGQGC